MWSINDNDYVAFLDIPIPRHVQTSGQEEIWFLCKLKELSKKKSDWMHYCEKAWRKNSGGSKAIGNGTD